MLRWIFRAIALLVLAGPVFAQWAAVHNDFAAPNAVASLGAYNVDPAQVSVSGFSTGGVMAMQLSVAYSSRIMGVGVFAGWHYDCRRTEPSSDCHGLNAVAPEIARSQGNIDSWSGNRIDPVANIARQKIYVFGGTFDSRVTQYATARVVDLYKVYAPSSQIHYDNTIPAEHSFPVDFDGPFQIPCGTAFDIVDCGFDGAGISLQWFYGPLNARNNGAPTGSLFLIDQRAFAPAGSGMDEVAWLYVPAGCDRGEPCKLHVFLHGCNSSYAQIGVPGWAQYSGHQKWADTNNIVLLFPQILPDATSPDGCWANNPIWGIDFDQKAGTQMAALMGMIARITSGYSPTVGLDLNQHGLTGSWYEKATDGQGVEVEVFPHPSSGTGSTFVSWFTYDTVIGGVEHQRWYTAQGQVVTGQPNASLTIYQNTGGNFDAPPATNAQAVGTATLSFDTCSSGQLMYSFSDGTNRAGTIALTRLTKNVTCTTTTPYPTNADFALSGNWYGGAAISGQGFTAEVNPNSGAFFAAWYTYMPNGTAAAAAGQRWYTAQGTYTPGMRSIPVTIYETSGGMFNAPTPPAQKTVVVGTGTMAFQSCSAATFSYTFTGGSSSGRSGTIALSRVGAVPPGCT